MYNSQSASEFREGRACGRLMGRGAGCQEVGWGLLSKLLDSLGLGRLKKV